MSLKELLSLKPDVGYFEAFLHIAWSGVFGFLIVFVVLSLLLILFSVMMFHVGGEGNPGRSMVTCAIISFLSVAAVAPFNIEAKLVDDWKEEYVNNYVKELDSLTAEINQLDIVNLEINDFGWGYDNKVAFSHEGKLVTKTNVPLKLDLESREEPFVSYSVLPEELEEWYDDTLVNIEIHFPKDQKFD